METSVYIPVASYETTQGYHAMKDYCEKHECPTAVVGADSLLVGVGRYLYEQGLWVPDNVSLVGLEDTLAHFRVPALTSLCFPVREIAETVLNIMLEARYGKVIPKTILFSPNIVERNSVSHLGMDRCAIRPNA